MMRINIQLVGALLLSLTAAVCGRGQETPTPAEQEPATTMFRHPDSARYFVAGQANIVFQAHAPFHSPYEGTNSLLSRGEYKTSLLGTVYLGYQLNRSERYATEGILDVEATGGRGLSEALGLAGFTNLDVVRNPSLGSTPYLARYEVHQTIGFTDTMVEVQRTPFSLATRAPERRLELFVGRMSLPDLFDLNGVGSDSHLQFLNWTADNNGAWDYAANTRGYTDAAVAQYVDKTFSLRYGVALMPTVANGEDLDTSLRRASGQNMEAEVRHGKGTVRVLAFVNHANMGVYRVQNALYLAGGTATPDITAHARQSTVKYGFGGNFEQQMGENARVYGRFGWNEGQHESYAYTEVDQTIAVGADYAMRRFGRGVDKAGGTVITNAIKRDHQAYLGLGGLGFLLGDGRLRYGREDIVEGYYNWHVWKGLYYAFDEQVIAHPGYNVARGPVMVETVRMHVDF